MKICHIIDYIPPYHERVGGGGHGIVKFGLEKNLDFFAITTLFDKSTKSKNIFCIPTLENYLGKMAALLKSIIPYDPVSYYHIKQILKKEKPQVVNLHNFEIFSFSAISAAKRLAIPIIYSIYDYWAICPTTMLYDSKGQICEYLRSHKCFNCVKSKKAGLFRAMLLPFTNHIFNKNLKKIDRFIVLSESSKHILSRYGISKSKIDVIPLPFRDRKPSKVKVEKNSILYVGWIEPHKGLHILIETMKIVRKSIPNAILYVVGCHDANPSYFRKIKDMIVKNKLNKNIKIMGRLGSDAFTERVNKSAVIAIAEQWQNMSPLFMAECMALEKPVVISDIGGISETIKDGKNGFLVKYNDPNDYAKRIIELLNDEKKANNISKKARKTFLEKFNNDKTFSKLEQSYKLAIENAK